MELQGFARANDILQNYTKIWRWVDLVWKSNTTRLEVYCPLHDTYTIGTFGSIYKDTNKILCGCCKEGVIVNNKFQGKLFSSKGYPLKVLKKVGQKLLTECVRCTTDDPELYQATWNTPTNLRKGNNLCGCKTRLNYDERQTKILLQRKLNTYGEVTYNQIGDYQGLRTLVSVIEVGCPSVTNTIHGFMENNSINPRLGKWETHFALEKQLKSNSETFKKYTYDFKNLPYVSISCPVCSLDPVTIAGGTDTFTRIKGEMLAGKIPCRCGNASYSKNDQELKIKAIITDCKLPVKYLDIKVDYEGGCSLGAYDYVNVNSNYLQYSCDVCNTVGLCRLSNFIKYHSRPCCKIHGGLNRGVDLHLYVTRWTYQERSFIKVGLATSGIYSRYTKQSKYTEFCVESTLKVCRFKVGNDWQKGLDLETELKSTLKTGFVGKDEFKDGFSETVEDSEYNIRKIYSIIKKYDKFYKEVTSYE